MFYVRYILDQRTEKYWGASRAEYTHNVIKTCVRFTTSSCVTLFRKCNNSLSFIQEALISNVKTLSTAEVAKGKSSRCKYTTK